MYDLFLRSNFMADEELKTTSLKQRKCFGLKERHVLRFIVPCAASFIGCILALAVYSSLAGKPPVPPRPCPPPPPPFHSMEMPPAPDSPHHVRPPRGEFRKHHPDLRKDRPHRPPEKINTPKSPHPEKGSTPKNK